eukprot:693979_1
MANTFNNMIGSQLMTLKLSGNVTMGITHLNTYARLVTRSNKPRRLPSLYGRWFHTHWPWLNVRNAFAMIISPPCTGGGTYILFLNCGLRQ